MPSQPWLKRLILNPLWMRSLKFGIRGPPKNGISTMMFFQASSASLLTLTPHFPFLCLSFYLQLSLLSEIHSWSIWDQLINSSVAEYFTSYLSKFLACFCCICWVITNLCCEAPSSQLCCSQLNLPDPYLSLICLMSECSELFSIVKYCITHFFF